MKHAAAFLVGLSACLTVGKAAGQPMLPEFVKTTQITEAAFTADGRRVLLVGRIEDKPLNITYFVTLIEVTSGEKVWKLTGKENRRAPAFIPGRPWVMLTTGQG